MMIKRWFRPLLVKNYFRFSLDKSQLAINIQILKKKYQINHDFSVFKPYIQQSSDCIQAFSAIQKCKFQSKSYYQLLQTINHMKFKNDNILLLKARIYYRVALNLDLQKKHKQAQQLYLKGLQQLENSMLPPVLQYYQIYRQYGFSLYQTNQIKQTIQVLQQSTGFIQDLMAHSDDHITSQKNSLQQAKAFIKLAKLDQKNRSKWLQTANNYWKGVGEQKYNIKQYAQTIYENALDKKKQNQKKAQGYIVYNQQFLKSQYLKQIIRKAL